MFRGSRIPSMVKNDQMLQKVCDILLEIEVDCDGQDIDVYHRLNKGSTVVKLRSWRKPSEIRWK